MLFRSTHLLSLLYSAIGANDDFIASLEGDPLSDTVRGARVVDVPRIANAQHSNDTVHYADRVASMLTWTRYTPQSRSLPSQAARTSGVHHMFTIDAEHEHSSILKITRSKDNKRLNKSRGSLRFIPMTRA